MDSIPVIDLDFFTSCEVTDSVLNDAKTKQIAEDIKFALHEIGFMYLINHRVPQVVVSLYLRLTRSLLIINYQRLTMHSRPVNRFLI